MLRSCRGSWVRFRRGLVHSLLVSCLLGSVVFAADTSATGPEVIVLGFDGADPNLVQRYMDEGLLPNLSALRRQGEFAPLLPTNPPQTPVSWSTFATGNDPGGTEIFDFLLREPGSYIPDFALAARGEKIFGFGEWNGWLAAAAIGLLAGLIVLLVLKVLGFSWMVAAGAELVVWVGITVALAGPIARLLPLEVPTATNNRQGTPFWTVAANHGKKVGIVRVPVTFPAEELPGGSKMISGLGVPDMRGHVGKPTLWSSDPGIKDRSNQFSLDLKVLPTARGVMEDKLIGPYNYPFHEYVLRRAVEKWKKEGLSRDERKAKKAELAKKIEADGYPKQITLPITLEVTDEELSWTLSGQSGTLKPGEWSDWVVVDYPLNWLVDRLQPLRGMGRFKLISLEPEVNLYFSPVNFHPTCHPIPYSHPVDLAEKLSDEKGLFKTIGWGIDTWSYPSGVGDIDLFLEDMEFTVERFSTIMDQMLDEGDLDMYVQIFYFPDRAGHMMWYQLDPGHPLHDPETAGRFEEAMRDVYRRMDDLVGKARARAGDDTLFLVVSDHGFSSFRRQINYNTWLHKKGYLVLKGQTQTRNLDQLFDKDVTGVDVFSGIDWSRTRAWAMGLGSLYVNLVGREPKGIVMPGEEYENLIREIKEGLEAEVDEATGLKPIYKVYTRDEIYEPGFDSSKIPDLRLANILDYRVSWQDTLGGLSTEVFEDNDRVWSGDHCSLEPSKVPGIFFINRKLKVDDPGIIDIAPSILAEMGLKSPQAMNGRVIWGR